ncbi:MAG: rhamnan synthesis F family protein [Eubacterium sp.]|nr:rhamnan synthesis F family protein [Eubacterium sp.]
MENVFDKKRKQNLNFILPSKYLDKNENDLVKKKKIAVIAHLYYLDTIEYYFKYIENIPEHIDILLTVSEKKARCIIKESILNKRKNCRIIEKENRGRDISAFLVACRKEILKYDYICFLHDKKANEEIYKADTEKWIQCLWENMIGSREYINNLLVFLSKNPKIGLLVPPSFMSEHFASAYSNTWYQNFDRVSELSEKMGLNCNLDIDKSPITLGTVFWARVDAIKKLLEIEWKYEDFDEEPLQKDGTLSHAIERILAYVVQDAGFDTGWVMTDRYAGEMMELMLDALEKAFDTLHLEFGIHNVSALDNFQERRKKLSEFVSKYKNFYIYGAGIYGKRCLAMLKSVFKMPAGFLVSDIEGNPEKIGEIPVFSFKDVDIRGCGVVIAVSSKYQAEVEQMIRGRESDFSDVYLYRN